MRGLVPRPMQMRAEQKWGQEDSPTLSGEKQMIKGGCGPKNDKGLWQSQAGSKVTA